MKLSTYLNFGGNCAEALQFYEKQLGAKVTFSMKFSEQPEPKNVPPGSEDLILHARFELGGMMLSANDVPGGKYQPMRSAYLTIHTDNVAEAERVYEALKDDGEIFMPMTETFFAERFAMFRDRFGVSWMILSQKAMNA